MGEGRGSQRKEQERLDEEDEVSQGLEGWDRFPIQRESGGREPRGTVQANPEVEERKALQKCGEDHCVQREESCRGEAGRSQTVIGLG